MTAAIEKEEGDTANEFPCPPEREDRLRIRFQNLRKLGGCIDARNLALGNRRKLGEILLRRRFGLNRAAWRDRKSTRLNSSHLKLSRMPSSA